MSLLSRHASSRQDVERSRTLLHRVRASNAPWLVELVVLYSLLLVLAFVLPGQNELTAFDPHPFWIPVLLLSVQYGPLGGFAAALVGSLLHWLIGAPVQAGGEDFYDYVYRIWREPMLWLGASVVLGGLRAQQIDKVEALRMQLGEAQTQRRAIAVLADNLKRHCAELERGAACAEDRSIESGLAALRAVECAPPERLGVAVADAVHRLLGNAAYTVMEVRDGRLQVHEALSVRGNRSAAGGVGVASMPPAAAEVLSRRRNLSVHYADDADLLAGVGVMASPIVAAGDRWLGALVVHTMDPVVLASGAEASVAALCGSIGGAWGKDGVVLDFDRDRIAVRLAGARGIEESGAATPARGTDVGSPERALVMVAGLDMRQRTPESFDARAERRQTT